MRSQWGYSVNESSNDLLSGTPGIIEIVNMKAAIGKILFGILGGLFLIWPSQYKRQYRITPLMFFSGYLFLCLTSVFWSANVESTVRNLLLLLIYMVGVLGAVRHLSTRQLLDSFIIVALIIIALGLMSELIHGTFTPLQSNYRFSGTIHPQDHGAICAILVLAAYCGLRQNGSNRLIYLAALVIGVSFLILSKSRTNFFGCILAVYLTSFWKTSFRNKQLLILIPSVFICMAVLITSFAAPDFLERLDVLINLGRSVDTSNILSLNNRIPVWLELKDYILQRPLLGYGYWGFWTPDMSIGTWGATHGHSVIIELLLQLGLVGALLYVLSFLSAFYWIVKDCTLSGSPERLFTYALTVYAIIFGVTESQLLTPKTFVAFTITVALFNCCIIKEKITN